MKIFLMGLLLLAACTNTSNAPSARQAASSAVQEKSKPARRNGDTLFVSGRMAVWYQPDSLGKARRIQNDTMRAGADDYMYYMNESLEYLDKAKLPVIECKPHDLIRFVLSDGSGTMMRVDSLEDPWGVILFDPHQQPRFADILDIEKECRSYYQMNSGRP